MKEKSGQDWDAYWRGMHQAGAFGVGGLQQDVLDRFWLDLFRDQCPSATHARILDLACGHGAVARLAIDAVQPHGGPAPRVHCLDYSAAAVAELRSGVPGVLGVCGDAARTPFPDAGFDVVVSQFGIEYAGAGAVGEALRLVAGKGVFAAVMHMKDGGIYRECARNVEVARAIRGGNVLGLARRAFAAGFALRDGRGEEPTFHQASEALAPAVRGLHQLMLRYGENVASGTAKSLHQDLVHMYKRMPAYDEQDVLNWISGMEREIETYEGRMASMLSAALDAEALARFAEDARSRGMSVRQQSHMLMGREQQPMAWTLVCQAA